MLYLGVDGGGTKTKVIVINEKHEIIYEGEGGPSSIDTVSIKETIEAVNEALEGFVSQNKTPFKSVFLGLGGIATDTDIKLVETNAKAIYFVDEHTKITARNDTVNALATGNHYDNGIVLICGTGMNCFGHNEGITHKSGGWGYKSGDDGSGYYLGIEAIKYMIRGYDGRVEITPFLQTIFQTLEVEDIIHIPRILDQLNRTQIASLAPIVRTYATQGDVYALDILTRGAKELALCVKAVYQKIEVSPHIVIVGSLGNIGIYKDMIHTEIKKINPDFEIESPSKDPALASALLAYKYQNK